MIAPTIIPALDRFLEAASVVQKWRTLNRAETDLYRAMRRAFQAQGRAFLREFGTLRGRFTESITADDWLRVLDIATGETRDLFLAPIQEAVQLSLLQGAMDTIAELGVESSFGLRNPRAVAYLDSRGFGLISQINETTRGNIATIVRNGVDEGWSYNKMATEIRSLYSDMSRKRATLIAVTETGNAYEAGSGALVQDLQDAGLRMEKQWLTVGDDRVSDGCRENQSAGWIPLAQSFPSGDMTPLRFPGCRCTTQYRRART